MKVVLTLLLPCILVCELPGMTCGVTAHITRGESSPAKLRATLDAMSLSGMKCVRADFDSCGVLQANGSYDFAEYDRIVDTVLRRKMEVLPIIYGPNGVRPPKSDEDFVRYAAYVGSVVEHYKDRISAWEIWNEANLSQFFDGADPVQYAKVLGVAYEVIKSVDSRLKVVFTGTSGIPCKWIERAFAAGATNCFDVMNIHPYSHPYAPEDGLCDGIKTLRKLMQKYNIGDKPIWITELGWPTHDVSIFPEDVLLAGLRVARPGLETWRIALADVKWSGEVDQGLADRIKNLLPGGSTVRAYSQRDLVEVLHKENFDAVVYPFDETYPIDTTNAVNSFVREGGTFVDLGGVPCYFGRRDGKLSKGYVNGEGVRGFPFGYRAFWSEGGHKYPRAAMTFTTQAGEQAGIKARESGFLATRFLMPDRVESEDEWIPLITGKTEQGLELTSAVVIRYNGSRKGRAVLCSLIPRGVNSTNSEHAQAYFTARAMIVSAMEDIAAYFAYNLRAIEDDPCYSESHFGLLHADFQPKPAFSAYANFVKERPEGAVSMTGGWISLDGNEYFPQWKRTDGVCVGALWSTESIVKRNVRFRSGKPVFTDMFGRHLDMHCAKDGTYPVEIGWSPIYFSGAELLPKTVSSRTK